MEIELTTEELKEIQDYYVKHFKHDSDYNPIGYIKALIKNKLMNKIKNANK